MDILILIVVLIIIVLCVIAAIYANIYNKFQDVMIRIDEVESSIDSNLRTKYDLLNRSVSLIKGNIDVDKDIFEQIVKLRSRKISNFELDRILESANSEFIVLMNERKELSKSDELKKISSQVEDIDEDLITLRDYYNSNITSYNKMIKIFPTNIVASICKYKEKLFYDRKDMSDDDYEDFKL